jgi:hypothetical protein
MTVDELIKKVNNSVEELDFASARIYIEENMTLLEQNKRFLKSNAREILNFLTSQINSGIKPLSRQEITYINAVNTYASQFDISGIKIMLRDNPKLFLREDIVPYLNKDANTILTSLGILKKSKQHENN